MSAHGKFKKSLGAKSAFIVIVLVFVALRLFTLPVSMPNKFRKSMWVKRGDFLLIEPIEEGDKVKAEICKILTPEHVKEYTKAGVWPDKFTKKPAQEESSNQNEDDSDFEDDLLPNTNRPVNQESSDEEEDEETSSDED